DRGVTFEIMFGQNPAEVVIEPRVQVAVLDDRGRIVRSLDGCNLAVPGAVRYGVRRIHNHLVGEQDVATREWLTVRPEDARAKLPRDRQPVWRDRAFVERGDLSGKSRCGAAIRQEPRQALDHRSAYQVVDRLDAQERIQQRGLLPECDPNHATPGGPTG